MIKSLKIIFMILKVGNKKIQKQIMSEILEEYKFDLLIKLIF